MSVRTDLRGALQAAVDATHGTRLLVRHARVIGDQWRCHLPHATLQIPLPVRDSAGRVVVLGAGKAAGALAQGLEETLGDRIATGLVIVKHGHSVPLRRIQCREAGHPVPDAAGAAATQELPRLIAQLRPTDLVICAFTGGASSLLVCPVEGIALQEKRAVHAALVRSGATIREMNVVRKHLSCVKGGQLARRIQGASLATLLISDVLGDDLATIASGPTVPDPSRFEDAITVIDRYRLRDRMPASALKYLLDGQAGRHAETPKRLEAQFRTLGPWILAGNSQALDAAARFGSEAGYRTHVLREPLQGDTHAAARGFAARLRTFAQEPRGGPARMLIAGGETTLSVRGSGLGGRCQEFALVAARELAGLPDYCLVAAGTDGTDGPTDAAGALVDHTTLARALDRGLDPDDFLRRNDSHRFFAALDDLIRTGPTGTNVLDVVAAVVP